MDANSENSSNQPMAFVAMCFDPRLQHVYSKVVKPVLENHGFTCSRGDEVCMPGNIMQQILEDIEKAQLVVCDLSFNNPNVFYELGIAHILKKATILISQSVDSVPFDVKQQRIITYVDEKLGLLDLRDKLVEVLCRTCPRQGATPHVLPPREFVSVLTEDIEVQRLNLFSSNVEFLRYAVKFLGEQGDQKSFDRIAELATTSDNPLLVRDAYSALHLIDPKKALARLIIHGLWSREYIVRERVVFLLGNYDPNTSVQQFMSVMDSTPDLVTRVMKQAGDTSWGVRVAVCAVLGKWKLTKTANVLQNALSDAQPEVRLAADDALKDLMEAKSKSVQPIRAVQ